MLQVGNLKESYSNPIKKEVYEGTSKYYLSFYTMYAYEDNSYNDLEEDDLKNALAKGLESFSTNLTVKSIERKNGPGGWPEVKVINIKPMTLKEFMTNVSKIFLDESLDWMIENCLEELDVLSIAEE